MTDVGGSTLITLAGGSIELEGVASGDLVADDFILA